MVDEDTSLYIEAFVESVGHGYRWRVCESDPGQLEIEYQEWNDEARKWNPAVGPQFSIPVMHAEKFCDAVMRVVRASKESV